MSDLACLTLALVEPSLATLIPKCGKSNCKDSHLSKFIDTLLDAKNSGEIIRQVLKALYEIQNKSNKSEKLAKTSKSIAKEILKAQARLFTCVLEPSVLGKM